MDEAVFGTAAFNNGDLDGKIKSIKYYESYCFYGTEF